MKVVNYVQIDFSKNKDITVPSMQYDSGSRWVRLKLFNNGIPVNLNGIRVCIMVAKPDGKEVFNDCVIVDAENGLVEFEITNQMVVVAGEVECQIKLMEQDKLLSSEIFTLFVNKGLTPTNIDSENELNVLVDALNRVEHLDQELSGEIMASFEASQTQRDETFKEKLLEYDERFLEIKGEKGDKGDKGDTGERGLQGPVGPQGSKGDMGEQGPVGPQGPKGDKGDQGEVGAIGPIGLQGPIGLTGPQGETGPQGPKGEKGLDGRSVELGVYGGQVKWRYAGQEENVGWTPLISLDSLRGSQGPQGEKGETGPQGPKGEKGDSGGVMPTDMVDYMGNQHETLKAKNDADVDWLLGEINTAHYDGQCITATDSIEGRAKSAILKGNTLLVDELGNEFETPNNPKSTMGTYIDATTGAEISSSTSFNTGFLKSPTVSFIVKGNNRYKRIVFYDENKTFISGVDTQVTDNSDVTITSNKIPSNAFYLRISASINPANANYTPDTKLFIEDINGNNLYSTQLVSVKLPVLKTIGKNLFDSNLVKSENNRANVEHFDDGIKITSGRGGVIYIQSDNFYLKNNTTYTISALMTKNIGSPKAIPKIRVAYYDDETNQHKTIGYCTNSSYTFNTGNNTKISLGFYSSDDFDNGAVGDSCTYKNIQLEEGSQATSYEPFKSNILTVNEDVELGGVDTTQDTLNVKTGEVVKRTFEYVLTGDEKGYGYSTGQSNQNDYHGTFIIQNTDLPLNKKLVAPICNRFRGALYGENKTWQCCIGGSYALHFFIPKSELETTDLTGYRNWVKKQYQDGNPIIVRYVLEEPIIKTVDLSDYHVYSFKDTTHYSCGSEDGSLIPSLSIDVPTNLPALVSRQRATIESQKEQIQTLEVENEILTNEIQRVDEKGEQADLEQLSMTWEIDYRVSEVEWFLEDNLSSTLLVAEKINLKLGGNTMALSRFEQAKILILAGAYNRETLEKQLTNYLKRGYLTTEEYDELIALMDAKELVSEN